MLTSNIIYLRIARNGYNENDDMYIEWDLLFFKELN